MNNVPPHSLSDSDDEYSEPRFKYVRLQNDFTKIWQKDAVSCVAIHSKFLAIGTQWGHIHILDHAGNLIQDKKVPSHSVAVNQLSIDNFGEYLASCSNDGKVIIYGLWSSDYSQFLSLDRPVKSVALSSDYSRPSSHQQFVTGDRMLILYERTLFSKKTQSVVYAGKERDGFIHNIAWYGVFIAFANETGVRVYDREFKQLITHVDRRHDPLLRSEIYPAHICWYDDQQLMKGSTASLTGNKLNTPSFIIGWANHVTVCDVKQPSNVMSSSIMGSNQSQILQRYVELRHMWDLGHHYVCGLSYTHPDKFIVALCVCHIVKPEQESLEQIENLIGDSTIERPDRPRVLLLEPSGLQDFELITEDIIEMRNDLTLPKNGEVLPSTANPMHFNLAGLPTENMYFLTGPKDVILSRPCNADDHVKWLLENGRHKRALWFTKLHERNLEKYTAVSVGRLYIDHLLTERKFADAAQQCRVVCGNRKELWEDYATRFEQVHQLRQLAPYLPTSNAQLEPECYEMVLQEFLRHDIAGFKRLIAQWSSDLYRVGGVTQSVIACLFENKTNASKPISNEENSDLVESLAMLYTYERSYDRALALYMKLQHRNVFTLIDRYRLFALVKDKIHELMMIDRDQAVRLLIKNEDTLPPSVVMKQLSKQPELQLAYLDRLFARGEATSEFADLAVSLYAEYDRKRLLPFLRDCEHYKLEKALDVCRVRHLLPEIVFLLARGGNRQEALEVIIKQSNDICQAIEFCKEHDDPDLWTLLIRYSVTKAEFITILMRHIGTHVDPAMLIRQIPPQMSVPDLRDSLVKVLQDFSQQVLLQEGCQRVLTRDCHVLLLRLLAICRRGHRVDGQQQQRCALCQVQLLPGGRSRDCSDLIVFACGLHCCHVTCWKESSCALKEEDNNNKMTPAGCVICLDSGELTRKR